MRRVVTGQCTGSDERVWVVPACRYGALFSSTRIPQKGKDRIVTQSVDQTFVIVQRGSAFYKVHIMDPKTCVPARGAHGG